MSRNLNQCSFIGRLTKDPEMRFTTAGKAVSKFSIAVNGRDEKSTQFINVVAWDKLAEICGEYLTKGRQVFVQGRYEQQTWEKDGQKHYKVEIVADHMEMLGSKEGGGNGKATNSPAPVSPATTM